MNQTKDFDLTIIVPIYNEEANLANLESRLSAYIASASRKACVLFVNDGSKDGSLAGIKEICERQPGMFYISFERNCGLTAAIKAGFDYTCSPLVGYIDADLQTAPEDFELLLPHTAENALVMGIRANRKDSGFKKLQSKIANGFRRMMTGDGVTDTGCPLKILHTDVAKRIPMFTGMHRFLPALVQLQNGTVKEIPVRHFPRTAGVSKFNLANRLVGPTVDCFGFRYMRKRWYNYNVNNTDLD